MNNERDINARLAEVRTVIEQMNEYLAAEIDVDLDTIENWAIDLAVAIGDR